jgi:hypothetical protein
MAFAVGFEEYLSLFKNWLSMVNQQEIRKTQQVVQNLTEKKTQEAVKEKPAREVKVMHYEKRVYCLDGPGGNYRGL